MLSSCFNQIPEHRQSNKITYSVHDALMSGFACMHFQGSRPKEIECSLCLSMDEQCSIARW